MSGSSFASPSHRSAANILCSSAQQPLNANQPHLVKQCSCYTNMNHSQLFIRPPHSLCTLQQKALQSCLQHLHRRSCRRLLLLLLLLQGQRRAARLLPAQRVALQLVPELLHQAVHPLVPLAPRHLL